MDANISNSLLHEILMDCSQRNRICIYEPTSVAKSIKIMNHVNELRQKSKNLRMVITPNRDELFAMTKELDLNLQTSSSLLFDSLFDQGIDESITTAIYKSSHVFEIIILKLGPKGVIVSHQIPIDSKIPSEFSHQVCYPIDSTKKVVVTLLKPKTVYDNVVSVTGAGDSLVGSFISGLGLGLSKSQNLLSDPHRMLELVNASMEASILSLQSEKAVNPVLSSRIFSDLPWLSMK